MIRDNLISSLFVAGFLLTSLFLQAQNRLSGGFETNSIYYFDDERTDAVAPGNNLGSNNYFKFDYQYRKFRAGIQYEAYLPVLQGLPPALNGTGIAMKYASFEDDNLTVTAGDFYEQFGAGLIFRAYEERQLGLNTAVEGVHIAYSFRDIVRIKGFAGRPREFMDRAGSTVKGASMNIDLASLLKFENHTLTGEINYIGRYMTYTGQADVNPNVNACSFRGNWMYGGFSLQGEYAWKSKDPALYNDNLNKDGSALLVELGYDNAGFGSLLSFRRLEYMQFGATRGISGVGRNLNYLPALTQQYSYSLVNLNPYNTMGNNEIGGQLDLHYRIKRNTFPGGKYGARIALNVSTYYNLKGDTEHGYEFLNTGTTRYYQAINVEMEKKLNDAFKLLLLYSNQVYNPLVAGKADALYFSNAAVADLEWTLNDTKSFRFEAQHLWTKDDHKNWTAALIEFNVAPAWSFFVNDMYNYGDTNTHYYGGGGSYTVSRTRIALKYGRNREGVICAGGVCMVMPAYTGFNLLLTSSF
jgi:hypothetical protein